MPPEFSINSIKEVGIALARSWISKFAIQNVTHDVPHGAEIHGLRADKSPIWDGVKFKGEEAKNMGRKGFMKDGTP